MARGGKTLRTTTTTPSEPVCVQTTPLAVSVSLGSTALVALRNQHHVEKDITARLQVTDFLFYVHQLCGGGGGGGHAVEHWTVNRGDGGSIPPTAVSKLRQFRSLHICLCLSEEILKASGPFYLMSMPGEVKDPTQGVNM